jgi:hypothetical protein
MPTLAHRRSVPADQQILSVTTLGSSSGRTPPGGGRLPKDDAPRVGVAEASKSKRINMQGARNLQV